MVWAKRDRVLLLAGTGLLIVAGAWRFGSRAQTSAPAVPARLATSSSVGSAPADSAPVVPRPALPFVYDCSGIGVSAPACSGVPAAAQALFQATTWFRVSAAPCGLTLSAKDTAALARVLKGALALSVEDLKPLERALLQNAALKLLSCAPTAPDAQGARELAQSTRQLLEKLALSAQQIAELPRASAQLPAWLGDSTAWERGAGSTHVHELADAHALVHHTLRRAGDLANVAELVLVDDQGVIHVTETAQRLLLRRASGQTVRICLAELDPAAAHCSASAELAPVTPDEPGAIIVPTGAPPCAACHAGSALRGGPYGPDKGLTLLPADTERVRAALGAVLTAPH
jgi:hypothetical protein